MVTSTAISLGNVSKRFEGSEKGIFDVSLRVDRGTSYALIGTNGAGKTTLMNICLGYLTPDSGEVHIDGVDAIREPVEAKARLAYVPEVARLYPHLTALQNMRFFEGLMGRRHDDEEYLRVLAHLGFPSGSARDRLGTYSKGMRQKVAIAIGLLKQANVFLLDEPTSGLDPQSRVDFARLVQRLRDDGKAILFSSHDLQSVDASADTVGVIHKGRLVIEEPSHLFRRRTLDSLNSELADA